MSTCEQRRKGAAAILAFGVSTIALGFLAVGTRPAQARAEVVAFPYNYPAGVIIINDHQRRLYFTEGNGRAVRYPIAVGMPGKVWVGKTYVDGKFMHPSWSPPAIVLRDHPRLPRFIPGGSPHNPMGVAAITLKRYEVAIHGTDAHMRHSVGTAASYGCIRMYNEDILDLFRRVSVGTPVIAVR